MTTVRYVHALMAAAFFLPVHLAAQDQAACTYYACALRLEGGALLSGVEGERITSSGFLVGPQLRPWMEVSDSATHYVDIVGGNYVSGQAMMLAGGVLWVGGLLALQGWDGENQRLAALGAYATGNLLFLFGNNRVARARDAMQSAIWWYNASLVGAPGANAPGPPSATPTKPVPLVGTHSRSVTALGLVAGALGGLAATSGMDSSQTTAGLSITLGLAAVGALIGHHVGRAIPRR